MHTVQCIPSVHHNQHRSELLIFSGKMFLIDNFCLDQRALTFYRLRGLMRKIASDPALSCWERCALVSVHGLVTGIALLIPVFMLS